MWILPEIFLNVFLWKESHSNIYLYCSRHRGCGTSIENILHHGCVACHLCANTQLIFYCERLIPRCRSSNIHHNDASRYNIVCKIVLYLNCLSWQNDSSPVYIMFKHCTKGPEGWVLPSTPTATAKTFELTSSHQTSLKSNTGLRKFFYWTPILLGTAQK